MITQGSAPRIFMAAGEVSGDRQGGHLARAILARDPRVELFGSGGESMRSAGVDVRVQTSHYGSVGIPESMRFFRPLRGVFSRLKELILSAPPDLAVLVDNEGFNGLLTRFLHDQGIPFIYYFPPQVWLWGEWRAKAIARRATAIIAAFSAEAEVYRREGGRVQWFGHPLLDTVKPDGNCAAVYRQLGLDPAARTIAVMPGSRIQEVEQLAAPMLGAVHILRSRHPDLQVILPVAAPHLEGALLHQIQSAGLQKIVRPVAKHVYTCMSGCELILLASGTATLEAALLGIPMVAAYRVSLVTYVVGRTLVRTRFIAMPNILLNDAVIPEFLQEDVTPAKLAATALAILDDPGRAATMRIRLRGIRPLLGSEGVLQRAASFILEEVPVLVERQPVAVR